MKIKLFNFGMKTTRTFKNGKKTVKEKAWHYHLRNPNVHYVFRWNDQYLKGYTFTDKKKYMWVW